MRQAWFVSLCSACVLAAQQPSKPVSTFGGQLPNGAGYEFREYIEPPLDATALKGFGSGARQGGQGICRYFVDRTEKTYYSYEVRIQPTSDATRFRVTFSPKCDNIKDVLRDLGPMEQLDPLPFPSRSLTVSSGDTLRWKVLENSSSGHSIVDSLHIFTGRKSWEKETDDTPARDVTLDAIPLHWSGPVMLRNMQRLHAFPQGSGMTGVYTWIEVPDAGRLIFAIAPAAGHPFKLAGNIRGPLARFRVGSDEYQVRCDQDILFATGKWNLYVLHDAGWKASEFGIGSCDRIEDVFHRPNK